MLLQSVYSDGRLVQSIHALYAAPALLAVKAFLHAVHPFRLVGRSDGVDTPPLRERERIEGDRCEEFFFTLQACTGVFWKRLEWDTWL